MVSQTSSVENSPNANDMGLTLKELQKQKPPFECPFCGKIYRSFSGISYHIIKYHSHSHLPSRSPVLTTKSCIADETEQLSKKQPLTYSEAQKMVEFDFDGIVIRSITTDQLPLEVESLIAESREDYQQFASPAKSPKPATPKKLYKVRSRLTMVRKKAATIARHLAKAEEQKKAMPNPICFELPEEEWLETHVPERKAYYRLVEKSSDELDEELEYGMDEEDYIWLEQVNEERRAEGLSTVIPEVFELLIDRLEKESHFETRTLNGDLYNVIDEDAVCSICCDGECSNSNVILFCDMCNLAVHQECYGVPYIPEGQWLCRRCLQSPSRPVDCALCPMKSGAFKQTDDNRWAHVVCALWIPEVCFANTVFLEPIDSIGNIPSSRWKLLCYICKRQAGACIQCFKTNCYAAFHVTCAQKAGLCMRMECSRKESGQPSVKKTVYCDVHTPKNASADHSEAKSEYCSDDDDCESGSLHSNASKSNGKCLSPTQSGKIRKMQEELLEKHTTQVPVVHIPFVPAHRMTKIVAQVAIAKKSVFLQQLQAYWMLKRQSRNGVPLLRRLQVNTGTGVNRSQREAQSFEELCQSKELKEQLRCWKQLRHDLERVRLLIELTRNREKMKRDQCKLQQRLTSVRLKPLQFVLQRTLTQLIEKDVMNIFSKPVTPHETHHEFIASPMDFSTMQEKLDSYAYANFDQFAGDFSLIVQNFLDFNKEESSSYHAALKMREECCVILQTAQRLIRQAGIDPVTGLHLERSPLSSRADAIEDVDMSTFPVSAFLSIGDKIDDLEQKLDESEEFLSAHDHVAAIRRRQGGEQRDFDVIEDQVKCVQSDVRFLNGVKNQAGLVSGAIADDGCGVSGAPGENGCEAHNRDPAGSLKSYDDRPKSDSAEEVSLGIRTRTDRLRSSIQERVVMPCLSVLPKSSVDVDLSAGRNRRSKILFNKRKRYMPVGHRSLATLATKTSDDLSLDFTGSPLIKPRLGNGSEESFPLDRGYMEILKRDMYSEVGNRNARFQRKGRLDGEAFNKRHAQHLLNSSLNFLRKTVNLKDDHRERLQEFHACRKFAKPPVRSSKYASQQSTSVGCRSLKPGMSRKRFRGSSETSGEASEATVLAVKRKFSLRKRGRRTNQKLSFSEELREIEDLDGMHRGVYMISSDDVNLKDPKVEPATIDMLQLVWAKCRGYPSYPAMTIDPHLPRSGYMANGVPITIPPKDVLRINDDESNYLILFFDARRTWQWLPRHNIEPLGVDSRLDEAKLIESRKPSMRRNVQEAYKRAVAFRRRIVMGEPSDPDKLAFLEAPIDAEPSVDGSG